MPYIIEVVQAGRTVEVMKYYSSRYGKKGKRGQRARRGGISEGTCHRCSGAASGVRNAVPAATSSAQQRLSARHSAEDAATVLQPDACASLSAHGRPRRASRLDAQSQAYLRPLPSCRPECLHRPQRRPRLTSDPVFAN